jgi:hypothetical protein
MSLAAQTWADGEGGLEEVGRGKTDGSHTGSPGRCALSLGSLGYQ